MTSAISQIIFNQQKYWYMKDLSKDYPKWYMLQARFNKLGICLSHSSKSKLLNVIGGHFLDKAVVKIKDGKTFRGTGDNLDIKILAGGMSKINQNKDLHLFASNLIENRITFNHLPNKEPICDISKLPRSKFSLDVTEWKSYLKTSKILIARVLIQYFPKFKFFERCIPKHIEHNYSEEMSKRSNIISTPIIDANENSYADCVTILRTYEGWIAELYQKAGLLGEIPDVQNPQIPNENASAGQTKAHINFTEGDPMKEMKVTFAGDQLTRVRFSGAKDLLAGSHTPMDRFEHCFPFKPVMWHTKASFLQYCYHLLHQPESANQIGTLKYFRERYNRKNATPSKVLNSYDGSESLFLSMGKAYIVVAAMKLFGMKEMQDAPTINKFPKNLINKSKDEKCNYLDSALDKFIDSFLLLKDLDRQSNDYVQNYGLCTIFLTILLLQLKDTAKEGDGDRNLTNQKLLLNIFKSLGIYSKYAIEMFVNIAQVESLLTPRLSAEFKWGSFVNWRGGIGNNMEDDLAQEITNNFSKAIIQRMGANKTLASITKICRASTGLKEIVENFNLVTGINKPSTRHTNNHNEDDDKEMVQDLLKLQPFNHTANWYHESFKNTKCSPISYLNILDFHQWIDKDKKEMKRI